MLVDQNYEISFTTGLTYALAVIQTPACGYSVDSWALKATGITGTSPENF